MTATLATETETETKTETPGSPRRWLMTAALAAFAAAGACASTRPHDPALGGLEGVPAEPAPLVVAPAEAAGALDPAASGSAAAPAPTPAAAAACRDVDARGISRAAIVRTVDAGFGAWLGTVGVAPAKGQPGNRFLGWQVERLPDHPCYARVDLRPGDIVTRVNGASLERPEQASELFQSLRTARALKVELLRDGAARSFNLRIHD